MLIDGGKSIYCPSIWGGLNGTRQPLQYPLNQSGVFDFAVHISDMNLRVLIVGNSLGEQLHAGLEEAMCYPIKVSWWLHREVFVLSILVGLSK